MNIIESGKTADNKSYFFEFDIDGVTFADAVERAYKKEVSKINIPGFRKGHAPRKVIEKMYGEGFFYEDAINELLPGAYDECLRSVRISVIDRPEVDIELADINKGIKGKFTVLLRPELTVGTYKGVAAKKTEVNITDEQVEDEIKQLQLKQSRLVPVEGRAAEKDDTATFDFEGFVDGVPFEGGKAENYTLVLGSHQFIEGFEDQMIGHSAGEEFDVNVRFPDDYGASELAGKDATFKIKLHELRTREMPVLDDEFAKDVSEFDTLSELREDIRKHLTEHAEEHAKKDFENAVMEKVTETLEGEVPAVMIDHQVDEDVHEFEYRLSGQGLRLKDYLKYLGQTEEQLREGFKAGAEKKVRTRLALEAVARAEGIKATDEDVENEYARIAEEYKMDEAKVKEMIEAADLAEDIAANRALDFVTSNAKAE